LSVQILQITWSLVNVRGDGKAEIQSTIFTSCWQMTRGNRNAERQLLNR